MGVLEFSKVFYGVSGVSYVFYYYYYYYYFFNVCVFYGFLGFSRLSMGFPIYSLSMGFSL